MISIHDHDAVGELGRRHRLDPYWVRRLRIAFHKKHLPVAEALEELPADAAGDFSREIDFHPLTLESRHDSKRDGATRLMFRTRSGNLIESVVLRIATGRTTLCLSTQSGCAAACTFCATGTLGLKQNLTAAEILDQVAQANMILRAEERRVRNLVFMGMGEPFHNEPELYRAIDRLSAREGLHYDPRRMLVSTVGIPDAMVRCATRFPRVRLALSLHSARQEVRDELMPVSQRNSLESLRAAIEVITAIQREPMMIEYLLLRDANDTPADLDALAAYLGGLDVHINLIPFNRVPEISALEASLPERCQEFSRGLKRRGFKVTTRYSLGGDIAAACGQLARVSELAGVS
jgi:23S rRNA (adenine2503-C2)-methyltransferase